MWWEAAAPAAPVHLDPNIRDWVLLPIFVVMFMQGLLRHYITQLLKDEKKVTIQAIQQGELLRRSQRLRHNNQYITPSAWRMRKSYFVNKAFKEKPKVESEGEKAPEMPAQDPMAMVGMMKQNMAMIVPNMLMMGWVSYFFSGFILVKLPFPLTDRFKDMLQRGIALKTLNPSYVSSLSWYFINLFGLRGLFTLILGANSATDDARMMGPQMATNAMAPQTDFAKVFTGERRELEITNHDFVVSETEYRLLNRTPPPRAVRRQ